MLVQGVNATQTQRLVTHIPRDQLHSFYRVSVVAQLLGCSYKHLLNMVKAGDVGSVKLYPARKRSTIRIPKAEVFRLMNLRASE